MISKTENAKSVLTKKSIVAMLTDDFSFFNDYLKNPQPMEHKVALSIGECDADISSEHDAESGLTKVLAQAIKAKCEVDELLLMAGQLLLHGTTKQIGRVEEDSNFGMRLLFNSTTKQIVEVSKFTILNLVVGIAVQARHSMLINYVGQRPVTSETKFEKPYVRKFIYNRYFECYIIFFDFQYAFSTGDIDDFIREQ